MDQARIAFAALVALGSGIALGLAANPTMRTYPETDWRARYRAVSPAAAPAPQPGVSYFGDRSTAWVYGGAPERLARGDLPPMPAPLPAALRDAPERWAPQPPPDLPPDDFDAQASAAERAAAQAAVSAALVRVEPRQVRADGPDPALEPDEGEPGG